MDDAVSIAKKLVQNSGRITFMPYNEAEEHDEVGGLPFQLINCQHRVAVFAFFLLLIVGRRRYTGFTLKKVLFFASILTPVDSVVQ